MTYPVGTFLLETHSRRGPRCVLEVCDNGGYDRSLLPVIRVNMQSGKVLAVCGPYTGYTIDSFTCIADQLDSAYSYTFLTKEEVFLYKLAQEEVE